MIMLMLWLLFVFEAMGSDRRKQKYILIYMRINIKLRNLTDTPRILSRHFFNSFTITNRK